MLKRIFWGLIFILLIIPSVFAEFSIKAEIDKQRIFLDDLLTYKVILSSDESKIPSVRLPDFSGFEIISQAQSSSVSFTSKGPNSTIIYTVILSPRRSGRFKVEPSRVNLKGRLYTTDSFEIEVLDAYSHPLDKPDKSLPEAVPQEESEPARITL
ncbi:MAG: BatD family protein [Candidatus Omnitrophica bacterium]|nr:BatD family protein [Candidatus Omnitrophota bacterium]